MHIVCARARQGRREDRLDTAGMRRHHDDAVGQINRFGNIVGDEQHSLSFAVPELEEFVLLLAARELIERAERLVHQQNRWIPGERAHDRHALLHSAREFVGISLELQQADGIEQILAACDPFLRRIADDFKWKLALPSALRQERSAGSWKMKPN